MPLSIKATDRLIERLMATYGAEWTRKWAGCKPEAVKTVWMNELEALESEAGHARIAWALSNLPDRCPNAPEFKRLCFQAPAPDEPLLPAPAADPERVRAEIAKLGGASKRPMPADMKDWARRLVARHEAGEKSRQISLKFAREALRMPVNGA